MALLDQLINQYGNASQNPYAKPQTAVQPVARVQTPNGPVAVPVASLIQAFGYNSNNPYASQSPSAPQNNAMAANPQIVAIDDQEAADAAAQQAPQALPNAAAMAARQGNPSAMPAAAQAQAAPAAQQAPAMASQQVDAQPVAQVDAQSGFPSPSDYNADGSQATPGADASAVGSGSLLQSLAGTAQEASQDPVKAKGLLSALGDQAQGIGSKLKSLSPAASQALIASGLTMLAGNDGTRNLSQLVGMGGIAGLNQYQDVNQNIIGNQLARQKLAQDLAEKQATNATANYNAATERFKATHPNIAPGTNVVDLTQVGQPGSGPEGQAPVVASGGVKAEGTGKRMLSDGSTVEYKTDTSGQEIPGTAQVSSNPNVGPLDPERLKVVNGANDEAAKQQHDVAMTQQYLSKLSPTMLDPQTGKQVPNPNYVNVQGGLMAKGQDMWTKLTGDQTSGQVLRNQLQQQTYQNFLATWKPGIGGRLTNTDVNLLKGGMPPDTAGSATWYKFLSSYGKLQADVADRSQRAADFMSQQRGQQTPLDRPLTTSDGMTFPAGSTYAQVVAGQGGTRASQSAQNGGTGGTGGTAPSQEAILAELKRRGVIK